MIINKNMENKSYYIQNNKSWLTTEHNIPIERMVKVPIRQYNFEDRIYFNHIARADLACIDNIFCDIEIINPYKPNYKPDREDLKILIKMIKRDPISIGEFINAERKVRAIYKEIQRQQTMLQMTNPFKYELDQIEKAKILKKEMENAEREKLFHYTREMGEGRHQGTDDNMGRHVDNTHRIDVDNDDDDDCCGGVLGVYGRGL